MEDLEIINLYWQRSESAIAETAKKYTPYCQAIALNILGSAQDAEECVSDTWLGAWNAMPPQRPSVLSAFFGKLTRNLSLDRWRAGRAAKRGGGETALALEELSECVSAAGGPAQAVEDRELEALVNRFLHTLAARDCDIFLLRYWYAEPLTAIARRRGIRLNTVKTSLYRSRGKLKAYLEQEGILL